MAATKQQSSSVNTGGSNYLPVFSLDGDGPHAANRDPLYAAMLNVPSPSINILNTIDEPIIDTIKRDVNKVAMRLKILLTLKESNSANSTLEWDLWGPLFMCLFLALGLAIKAGSTHQAVHLFTLIFVLTSIGSLVVTLNNQVLGFKRCSILQSISLLGYGLGPLAASTFINQILLDKFFIIKLILVVTALTWSTMATIKTLNGNNALLENKRLLAIYPTFLFYFINAWLILVL